MCLALTCSTDVGHTCPSTRHDHTFILHSPSSAHPPAPPSYDNAHLQPAGSVTSGAGGPPSALCRPLLFPAHLAGPRPSLWPSDGLLELITPYQMAWPQRRRFRLHPGLLETKISRGSRCLLLGPGCSSLNP